MGKIIHGSQSFGYAPITESGGTYSFGTPVALPGLTGMTIDVEQSNQNVYADNKVWAVVKGAKVRSAEATFRYISDAYAVFMGYKKNENGMLTDTGIFPMHCIFFESIEEDPTAGTETRTLHYLYSAQASTPAVERRTDEEEVEASELAVSYSCTDSEFVVDDDGEACQYGYITRTAENAALYDTFMSAVILPTTSIPSV